MDDPYLSFWPTPELPLSQAALAEIEGEKT